MTKQESGNWLDRIPIDIISIVVMIASAFLDGRYLTRYSYKTWWGIALAYVFNSVADVAVNKLSRTFVRLRLNYKLAKWTRRLTWALIPFWLASFYFTLVFSWREATLQQPTEPQWLHWSVAAIAPTILTALGLAGALRSGKQTLTQKDQDSKPIKATAPRPAVKLQGEALREAVLDAMLIDNSLTYDALAEKLGSRPSTVGYHVRQLSKAGKLNGQKGAGNG